MTVKHLDHLNLTVSNLRATIDWYRAVFGFEVVERGVRRGAPWAIIKSGEAMLCIYEDAERTPPSRYLVDHGTQHTIYHFGLRITDREAWLAKVEEYELALDFGGVNDYPHSTSWYVTDPSGYSIEVALWNNDEIRFEEEEEEEELEVA
jgi:catechol 2,3-dioxygenase-like lactoylglutathione lyase family enzyme